MKILSIDLDYAFSPDISKYDDFVTGSSLTSKEEWEKLEARGFTKPRVNKAKLDSLVKVYSDALSTAKEVHFISDHHEIVSFFKPGCTYEITNFDHHHDVFYPGWHNMDNLDEGNWVGWVDNLGLVSSYTWYRNPDSEDLDPSVKLKCNYSEFRYDNQRMPKFDVVFICSSPNWVHEDNTYIVDLFKGESFNGKIRL